jgi:hypothetical protein
MNVGVAGIRANLDRAIDRTMVACGINLIERVAVLHLARVVAQNLHDRWDFATCFLQFEAQRQTIRAIFGPDAVA